MYYQPNRKDALLAVAVIVAIWFLWASIVKSEALNDVCYSDHLELKKIVDAHKEALNIQSWAYHEYAMLEFTEKYLWYDNLEKKEALEKILASNDNNIAKLESRSMKQREKIGNCDKIANVRTTS